MSFVRRVVRFKEAHQGPEGLFFIKRVNHPLGAVIAVLLLDSPITPNMVTVAGLLVHVVAALVVATASPPIAIGPWLFVAAAWQFAFSLDCADGQLARARSQASAFGAWLDQVADVATHGVVYTALVVYLVRALQLEPVVAAAFGSFIVWINLLQLFESWQRASILGMEPALHGAGSRLRTVLLSARHLLDYGAFLFVASLLLPWPTALLIFVAVSTALHGTAAGVQLALNWRRRAVGASENESVAPPLKEPGPSPSTH
jgi:phosphatidylglycerophosphate synthase